MFFRRLLLSVTFRYFPLLSVTRSTYGKFDSTCYGILHFGYDAADSFGIYSGGKPVYTLVSSKRRRAIVGAEGTRRTPEEPFRRRHLQSTSSARARSVLSGRARACPRSPRAPTRRPLSTLGGTVQMALTLQGVHSMISLGFRSSDQDAIHGQMPIGCLADGNRRHRLHAHQGHAVPQGLQGGAAAAPARRRPSRLGKAPGRRGVGELSTAAASRCAPRWAADSALKKLSHATRRTDIAWWLVRMASSSARCRSCAALGARLPEKPEVQCSFLTARVQLSAGHPADARGPQDAVATTAPGLTKQSCVRRMPRRQLRPG